MSRTAQIVCREEGDSHGERESRWKITWSIAAHKPQFYQLANITIEAITNAGAADELLADVGALTTSLGISISLEDPEQTGTAERGALAEGVIGRRSLGFLVDILQRTTTTHAPQAITLIAPRGHGNIMRADIVSKRMHDVDNVEATATLAEPLQLYTDESWTASTSLSTLFRTAAGAIRLSPLSVVSIADAWTALERELEKRLSLPLLLTGLKRRLLFMVEGGLGFPFGGACSWQLYETAKSLGIDLVVLAEEGHALKQQPEFGHWYHHFIPIQCGYDTEFPARIVSAVKQYEQDSGRSADGLLTAYESYHVAVATAAQQLGLSHEPLSAYEVATDKFKTSLSEGRKSYTASSVDQALHIARTEDLPWPLIIKPCRGWASELVFKVDDIEQLEQAAPRMRSDSHGAQFVMEHYCSGPEVDINFVLYNGEVCFWDIGDETPKNADGGSTSFGELDYLFPSQLPEAEQRAVYDAVLRSMTRLGFRNGIYHCEARIENSLVEWRLNSRGIPSLEPRQEHNGKPAESWLIEINTRPPGGDTCDFIEATWGVDYWALLLVTKLRNASAWVHALSQPYRDGAQYHADKVWIIADWDPPKKGIWESGNITEELLRRRPDLAKHVSQHRTFAKKGDQLRHQSSGANSFVAYLHIFSRHSRIHLLELATEIRNALHIEIS
ncbi:hypothetical protein PTNB73_10093 [Pyrenophora teres f. teres]|nr:hypothetical protein PTNB73_10093 [Pyrenophora teres f. teres]